MNFFILITGLLLLLVEVLDLVEVEQDAVGGEHGADVGDDGLDIGEGGVGGVDAVEGLSLKEKISLEEADYTDITGLLLTLQAEIVMEQKLLMAKK